jgi:hypothetical protein
MKLFNCDFCYVQVRQDLAWSHIFAPRIIPSKFGVPSKEDDGEWAACEDCHQLIEAEDVDGLWERSCRLDPLMLKVKNAGDWKRWLFTEILTEWELIVPPYKGSPPQYMVRDAQHRGGGIR